MSFCEYNGCGCAANLRTYPKNEEITFLYSKNLRFFEYKKVDPFKIGEHPNSPYTRMQ
jgi:hypothetical protein